MKKVFLALLISSLACIMLTMTSFAAQTNEFGAVEELAGIDLTNMSSDTTSRVVLFDGEEYHTYPARYIIGSSSDLSVNFSKINAVTKKGYGVGSIIRIEIPTNVKKLTTAINGNQGGKSIVEVTFPKDTQVTEIVWGALMNCTKLEGITIPATVTTIGQDAFSNCAALAYVNFEENGSLESIGPGCFGSCKMLTEFVVPNTVKTIQASAFYNCTGLKKLVLGAGVTVFGGQLIGAYGYSDKNAYIEFYMNGSFATGEGSLASGNFIGRGNGQDLKNYVIFFTGTKAQALSLVNKYNSDINFKDANIVAFDPDKTSGREYLGMEAYTTDIAVNTNRVIVYGYGVCDAFYEGTHQMAGQTTMHFTGYFEDITFGDICTRKGCGEGVVDESRTISAMFTYMGYSCTENLIGGTSSMSQFYKINKESIKKYNEATGNGFSYGFVFSTIASPIGNPMANEKNVIIASGQSLRHDYAEVRAWGIPMSSTAEQSSVTAQSSSSAFFSAPRIRSKSKTWGVWMAIRVERSGV